MARSTMPAPGAWSAANRERPGLSRVLLACLGDRQTGNGALTRRHPGVDVSAGTPVCMFDRASHREPLGQDQRHRCVDPQRNRLTGSKERLFTADADLWGGAYVEDELLVVKVVGQTLDAAQRSLNAVGVTAGIKLVSSDVSLAALEAQQARVTKTLEGQESLATSWGPDYSTSSIVVGLTRPSARLEDILKGAADPDGPPVTTFVSPGEPVAVSGAHDTP